MKIARCGLVLLLACEKPLPAQVDASCPPCASASASAPSPGASIATNDKPPRLENTCKELREGAKGTIGRAYKDLSVYGTAIAFSRDVYYGTVAKGSELELLERTPVPDPKYKWHMVKVRVVCVAGDRDELQGRVVWAEMKETSFSDAFDPRTGKIEQ